MSLTPKQEKFCLAYIQTGNASEAYRRAYNTAKMKTTTVNRNAKTQLTNSKIAARIKKLSKPAEEKAIMTMESHLERLRKLSENAEDEGAYAPAIAAEVNRGRVMGYYVDRKEIRTGPLDSASDEALDDLIERQRQELESAIGKPDANVH